MTRKLHIQNADGTLTVRDIDDLTPVADEVRLHTAQRLQDLFKVQDDFHLTIAIQDATLDMHLIVQKIALGETVSQEERGQLEGVKGKLESYRAIKSAGNTLEAMDPIPEDFFEDAHWPDVGQNA